MHNSDPSDMHAERPRLGDRIPPRPPHSLPERSSAELDAFDQTLDADADFETLVRRYSGDMAAAIRRAGIVRQDVIEEAIQDAFRKFFSLPTDNFSVDDVKAWLVVVATRNAISLVKKQSNRDRIDEQRAPSVRMITGPSDDEVVVRDLIDSFPPEHAQVVDMVLEGYNKSEIADALKISESGVYRHIAEIKRRLAPLYPERKKSKSARRR